MGCFACLLQRKNFLRVREGVNQLRARERAMSAHVVVLRACDTHHATSKRLFMPDILAACQHWCDGMSSASQTSRLHPSAMLARVSAHEARSAPHAVQAPTLGSTQLLSSNAMTGWSAPRPHYRPCTLTEINS